MNHCPHVAQKPALLFQIHKHTPLPPTHCKPETIQSFVSVIDCHIVGPEGSGSDPLLNIAVHVREEVDRCTDVTRVLHHETVLHLQGHPPMRRVGLEVDFALCCVVVLCVCVCLCEGECRYGV